MKKKLIIFYYKYIYKWYLSLEDTSIDYNRMNGRFKVKYADGQYSIPMLYKTAVSYSSIFGGEIIFIDK